jgi:glycosyltransferase involved in cell wall biosynthesis
MLARAPVDSRLIRPVVFARPTRLVWPPSWAGHLPFAFWIVDALRPRTFVELGTHTGVSYSAFVQGVQELGIGTACYAVDTWAGDAQAGFYGEEVYAEWSAFHDRQFAGASRLVRTTFDEAVCHFADESIDLLHIDGLHTYEAVRHDFETWRPKVSRRGVVLFHDVNAREGDFGAWRYWDELGHAFPSFTFLHGHGLGVLAVGPETSGNVAWLTTLPNASDEAVHVRRFFSTLGELWTSHILHDRARDALATAQRDLQQAGEDLARVSTQQAQLRQSAAQLEAHVGQLSALSAQHAVAEGAWREQLVAAQSRIASSEADAAAARGALEAAQAETRSLQGRIGEDRAELDARDRALASRARQAESAARARTGAVEASVRDRVRARSIVLTAMKAASAAAPRVVSARARLARRLRWSGLSPEVMWRHPVASVRALGVLAHRGFRDEIAVLGNSGLFDEWFYSRYTQTQALPVWRLREHFIRHGDRENLSPQPLFDAGWYRATNPDLPSGTPVLTHYIRFGAREGRHPHPLFNSTYYSSRLDRRLEPGESPLAHYVRAGAVEGVSPHPLFDPAHYVAQHPGVAVGRLTPLAHYLVTAFDEQLDPHPLFSTSYYVAQNADIGRTNPLVHFVLHGAFEGRAPHPLFDVAFYIHRRPDVRQAGLNPLEHYLHAPTSEDVDPHPLFDTSFYLDQAGTLARHQVSPLVHFVEGGWRLGLRPNPWFDPLWYLDRNPDIPADVNPLVHYVSYGWREGRDPSPEFSIAAYLTKHPDVAAARVDPLAHYIEAQRGAGSRLAETGTAVFQVTGAAAPGEGPETVVVVSHVSPSPVRAGNEYRLDRLLHFLKRRGSRIVLVLAPIPAEPLAPGAFESAVAEFGNVVLCDAAGAIQFTLRDCPDVLSRLQGRPIPAVPADGTGTFAETDRAFCHDTVCAVVAALTETLGRVALVAQYIFMTRFLPMLGGDVLRIVDTIDVFSQKGTNVIGFGIADAEVSPSDEARRLERADVVVAIHDADASALKALVPAREVLVAGVDADVETSRRWPSQPVALLAGSSNPLNLVGLRDFLRFAWPTVRQRVPTAVLRVAGGVGRGVPPGSPGVEVLGHVQDLAAEYLNARVAINPTVAGTGLKIKTVEALAHATPVVGWPHSRDGLSARLAPFVFEARDWHDFAAAVSRGLEESQCPFDATAVQVIREELSGDHVYRALDERLTRFFTGVRTDGRP